MGLGAFALQSQVSHEGLLLLSPSGRHSPHIPGSAFRFSPGKNTGRFGRGAGPVRAVFGAGRTGGGWRGWVRLCARVPTFGGNGLLLAGLLAALTRLVGELAAAKRVLCLFGSSVRLGGGLGWAGRPTYYSGSART